MHVHHCALRAAVKRNLGRLDIFHVDRLRRDKPLGISITMATVVFSSQHLFRRRSFCDSLAQSACCSTAHAVKRRQRRRAGSGLKLLLARLLPDPWSEKILSQPAACSALDWRARSCRAVLTLA
jgi:hypothetical protein